VLVAAVAAVIAVGIALAPTVSSLAEKGTGGPANTSAQGGAAAQDPAAQEAATQLEQSARRTPHDPMALGKVDAPVVMVAYSEFQLTFRTSRAGYPCNYASWV
jgi:protein-disulfide isomerase